MDEILQRLGERFRPDRIAAYLADVLPDVVVATAILLAWWLIWRVLSRGMRAVIGRTGLDQTAADFVQTVVRLTTFTIGAVAALAQLGVNMGSVIASLGVAGLTIGFAAKDALSNIISGLFIFWDRPFVIGDLVEISGYYGRVETITLRSTRVVTPDGKMLAIPNAEVLNSTVASYTNFPHLRLDIDITVGVEEDLGRVRRLLLELIEGDPRFLGDRPAKVVVTSLNDYNVAVQLRAWLRDEKEHLAARHELRERAFEALRGAGVDMPYETLALAPVTMAQAA